MQSIFGDTSNGVPNPRVFHVHPYPTRYHGSVWRQPQAMYTYQPASWANRPFAAADVPPPASPQAPESTTKGQRLLHASLGGAVFGGLIGCVGAIVRGDDFFASVGTSAVGGAVIGLVAQVWKE